MKRFSFDYGDGNRLIDLFMSDRGDDDMSGSYATASYQDSWDLLMKVIRKIKQHVFKEGYDLFMPEHSSYLSIGNACYDADLEGAWISVVKWIVLRQDLTGMKNIEREYRLSNEEDVVFSTKNNAGVSRLRVSPHVIQRWKQRIDEKTSINDICDRVTGRGINTAYSIHGDGKYYLGNGLVIAIENFKILTIYKGEHDDSMINQKISDLTDSRIKAIGDFVRAFGKSKSN